MTCAKEPDEIILSRLPTSKELDRTDFSAKDDIEKIKAQLKSVIEEYLNLRRRERRIRELLRDSVNL